MSVGRKPTGRQHRAVMSIANRCFVRDACQPDAVASFSHTTWHPVVSEQSSGALRVRSGRPERPLWLIPTASRHGFQRDLALRNPLIFRGLAMLACVFLQGVQGVCLRASFGVLPLAWSVLLIADAAGSLRAALTRRSCGALARCEWVHLARWRGPGVDQTDFKNSAKGCRCSCRSARLSCSRGGATRKVKSPKP
jgi:hypothetical protein